MAQQARSHLNKGDTVKLTKKAVQAVRSATARTRGVEWATRRGVVASCTKFSRSVLIRWEGRKSIDIWPVEAVEKIL